MAVRHIYVQMDKVNGIIAHDTRQSYCRFVLKMIKILQRFGLNTDKVIKTYAT